MKRAEEVHNVHFDPKNAWNKAFEKFRKVWMEGLIPHRSIRHEHENGD